jgi:ABC-2 type transport system permease protein
VQPFVEYQPISRITDTLRGLAIGKVEAANLMTTMTWCIGLLVGLGYLALHGQGRRR